MTKDNTEREQIEALALEIYPEHPNLQYNDITKHFPHYRYGFVVGYKQCQSDIKPNLEELKSEFFGKFGNESFRGYPLEQCHLIFDWFKPHLQKQNDSDVVDWDGFKKYLVDNYYLSNSTQLCNLYKEYKLKN